VALASNDPLDNAAGADASRLNERMLPFRAWTFSAGVHSISGLCGAVRAIGQLSIFGVTRKAPEFPPL